MEQILLQPQFEIKIADATTPLKTCNKCGQQKPRNNQHFSTNRNTSDKLFNRCKECCTKVKKGII